MKVCGACCKELPKESFSNKQYKLKQHQRRCKECIDANAELQLEAPPKKKEERSEDETNKPECWICLDDGPDENGGMPRRDCSCRGDAGFAHLMCLQVCKDNSLKETDSICESKTKVLIICILYLACFILLSLVHW